MLGVQDRYDRGLYQRQIFIVLESYLVHQQLLSSLRPRYPCVLSGQGRKATNTSPYSSNSHRIPLDSHDTVREAGLSEATLYDKQTRTPRPAILLVHAE
ncbi:hypothetical protein ElyMa_003064800 [Elysia marginata]|uniref:Uncharacterized protein n=1 Tax=Elysia marginata TaxID=1093978 RepID=A0AAV4ILN7_9GAST|nr:hypothetical protein ElyMa_003064800 [Elysia marginata]